MSKLSFDHLAIAADNLTQGVRWARQKLGVELPPGGAHPKMGTHNHLAALSSDTFLEIITIDPQAEPPARPRWFALDDAKQKIRLGNEPALITWVVGTPDIHKSLKQARDAGYDLGEAVEMSRGDLTWLISIRKDGQLLEGGTAPVLVQWPEGPHAARRMTDLGLRLQSLTLYSPEPEKLSAVLRAIGADHLVGVEPAPDGTPYLQASIDTADGRSVLL